MLFLQPDCRKLSHSSRPTTSARLQSDLEVADRARFAACRPTYLSERSDDGGEGRRRYR